MIDWAVVGTGAGVLLTNVFAYFAGKGKREVQNVTQETERDVIILLRTELERLSARVSAMENREGRLIRHVYRLEGLMRAKDIEPPPFEIDGDYTIKVGGTD